MSMHRASERTALPRLTDRLPLGPALRVSPFCLGSVATPRAVMEAFDRGINFFFISADMHWPHYEQLRRGLEELLRARPGVRDQIVVGSVSYVAQPEFAVAPFHEVLEAVPGLERIDLTIVGGVLGAQTERFRSFAAHRDGGSVPGVRAVGATFHDRAAAAERLAADDIDIAFVRYNADFRKAEHDLFPTLAQDRRSLLYNFKTTLGYVPHARFAELGFAETAWRPTVTDHYRFVLTRPEIDGLLCSPRTPEEVIALERALEAGPLGAREMKYMRCLTDLHLGRALVRKTNQETALQV
jgi:hypothetical protein